MRIAVIGTGFVGVVFGAVFADLGNDVIGLDIDPTRIDSLRAGRVPFYEPDLEVLLQQGLRSGKLTFTTSYEQAISDADLICIAVGTPSAPDGQADLRYVFAASESLAAYVKPGAVIAIKSTVPPGTCDRVSFVLEKCGADHSVRVVSLPEFLREGSAVADTLHPDRIVIGAQDPAVIEMLRQLHAPLNAPVVVMNPASAQMCKYAANSYLATRITFINQIANLCEANGADVKEVIKGIGYDKRIGSHYWYPGLGYGGSCFPKDVKELAAYARAVGQEDNLMVTITELNEERIPSLMRSFAQKVGGFEQKRIAVLGLSFKPNTDDMREAPSTKIIPYLLHAGASVAAYDPMARNAAADYFRDHLSVDDLTIADTVQQAVDQADILFVLVEWSEFVTMNLKEIAQWMRPHAFVIDARDQFDKRAVLQAGLSYIGIGVV